MSIIKEKILYNSQDMNLKFTINSDNSFVDFQQEIDNLTQVTSNSLINPVQDSEVRRFKLTPNTTETFNFYFANSSGNYDTSFINAGFTQNEINNNDITLLNSFFILDFYNSFETGNQTKIFSTYLTKILGNNNNKPIYNINSSISNQFYNLYVPISFINAQKSTIVVGYSKFSFFNSKNGYNGIKLFYNQDYETYNTSEKMYFKTTLDLVNMTWVINTPSYPNVNIKQLITSTDYIKKINDSFDTVDNKKQVFPTGNTFNYQHADYFTT